LIFGLTLFVSNPITETEETKNPTEISNPKNASQTSKNLLFLPNNFSAFKEALAFKESQGKYRAVNTLGYLGKYQFGLTTLERFKIYNSENFLMNPELQEKAFLALCSVNKWILRKDILRKVGTTINGIKITESGILAAAHLSGAGNVKKYLRSNGSHNLSDAYGSTIQYYMQKFAGYNLSEIKGNRKATV
jgi:hypothetical protein